MEVSDAKKLRELEDENRRLKRLLAEAELDKAAMKEVIELGPFAGSGTTLVAAERLGYHFTGIEIEAEYVEIIKERLLASYQPDFEFKTGI